MGNNKNMDIKIIYKEIVYRKKGIQGMELICSELVWDFVYRIYWIGFVLESVLILEFQEFCDLVNL